MFAICVCTAISHFSSFALECRNGHPYFVGEVSVRLVILVQVVLFPSHFLFCYSVVGQCSRQHAIYVALL